MPENSPEWKALKQIFDAADKDVPGILRERAVIDKGGNLYLSRRVRKFAGIQTSTVTIIGSRQCDRNRRFRGSESLAGMTEGDAG